ncbi:YicC/YloC family endoribonuclease [Bacillus sp. B15-48]|uniref:YicC/YloC family endoribonuclease n=1 Tax=Bacillus sp. B15-48 TaxID=1548601 RepID=UPI00193F26B0|nr:YicC/YloC family endoribonuclease [Bacillus sp. B15-48]MBM4763987.1 YicC family protein [Bacillus sp. B15-48]
MVVSMTGFGRSRFESDRYGVTVEVKTVNHRFCEFHIRMPSQLLKIESNVKKSLATHIKRGRVEVYVTLDEQSTVNRGIHIDWELLDQYIQYINEIKNRYKLDGAISIPDIVVREELIQIEEQALEDVELEKLVLEAAAAAANEVWQMRQREGLALEKDIKAHLHKLKARLNELRKHAPTVVEQYRDRLTKRMAEFVEGQIDDYRILTEVAIFADKADVNEEITRLESHIHQFFEILSLTDPIGRKLDFLVQEMNREVNTIGSKANDSNIAMEVVEMKSYLEKIKEQVQNIE